MITTHLEKVKKMPALTFTPLFDQHANIFLSQGPLPCILPAQQCFNRSDANRICPVIKIWLNVSCPHLTAQNGNTVTARKSTSQSRMLPNSKIEQMAMMIIEKVDRYGLKATLSRFVTLFSSMQVGTPSSNGMSFSLKYSPGLRYLAKFVR